MKYMLIFYRVTGRYISLYLNHHIDVNFKLSLNHNSQTLHNATKHLAELTLVFITYEFYCALTKEISGNLLLCFVPKVEC